MSTVKSDFTKFNPLTINGLRLILTRMPPLPSLIALHKNTEN
jgi:hypothetical protein